MFYFFFIPRPKRERERKKKSENKYARGKKGPKKECPILFERERERREKFFAPLLLSLFVFFSREEYSRGFRRSRERRRRRRTTKRVGGRALSSGEKKVRENKNDREKGKIIIIKKKDARWGSRCFPHR